MDNADAISPPADALIIGAGLAGLFLALRLAPRPCLVVSPAALGEASASAWAQGGLAAAMAPGDSPEAHAQDTIAAGAGLVDPVVARLLADDGPDRVRDLLALGVPFDRSPEGALKQSLEAAHSFPRVVRVAGDLAGRAIMTALTRAAAAAAHIRVLEHVRAVALLQSANGAVVGALCRDSQDRLLQVRAPRVVLASGGSGGLWPITTNPASALGQGLAMAARAGALIADPEFVQFHPTAIDLGLDPAPLATEALRGEGARLVDAAGFGVMARHDPRGDLAPRDVVARAIHRERAAGREVFLDAREAVGARFPEAFPTVFQACQAAGLDPRSAPIPVAPAAHYHMGGVATDLWARTSLPGLSAIGECSATGAHGANRLASNSLLEAVVFAERCAERIKAETSQACAAAEPATAPPELPVAALAQLRAMMGAHAGVERSAHDRARAVAGVRALLAAHGPANALIAALLVVEGAARRLESRGGHFCPDHPAPAAEARRTFLTLGELEP